MDQTGCDELRLHEENLDTLMWFKLLFVPSLGIVILVLFLLEEYCSSLRLKEHEEGVGSDDGMNIRQRKIPRSIFGRSRARLKQDPCKVLRLPRSDRTITLNLIDENGTGNVFKIEAHMTMKEVLQHYCDKRDQLILNSIILRYMGKRISFSDTPDKLGITESANIEMETDYMGLVNQLRTETVAVREQFAQLLSQDEQARLDSETKNGILQTRMDEMVRVRAEMAEHLAGLEKEKDKLSVALSKLENELQTHREARRKAEVDRSKVERELEADKDLKEKRRLEKTLDSITKEVASIERLLDEAKRTYENGYKERSALRDSLADSLSKVEGLEKELETWKQQSLEAAALVEKVEKMEKLKTETTKLQQKVEAQLKENTAAEAEIAKLQAKASDYDICCTELTKTKAREKAAEREIDRLSKWKSTILKAHEKESKEVTRKREHANLCDNEKFNNINNNNNSNSNSSNSAHSFISSVLSPPTSVSAVSAAAAPSLSPSVCLPSVLPLSASSSSSSFFIESSRISADAPISRPRSAPTPIGGLASGFPKIMPRPISTVPSAVSQYPRIQPANPLIERHAQFLQPLSSVVRPPPSTQQSPLRIHQHLSSLHFQPAPHPPSSVHQQQHAHQLRIHRRDATKDIVSAHCDSSSSAFQSSSPVFSPLHLPRSPPLAASTVFSSDFRPNSINHMQAPRPSLPSNLPQLFEGGFAAPLFIIDDHASPTNKPLLIIDDAGRN